MKDEERQLMSACVQGNRQAVHEFAWSGADVNVLDESGLSPLMRAVIRGNKDCVQELLDAGALVDRQNLGGQTALMWAWYCGHRDLSTLLLQRGADASIKDAFGRVPSDYMRAVGDSPAPTPSGAPRAKPTLRQG